MSTQCFRSIGRCAVCCGFLAAAGLSSAAVRSVPADHGTIQAAIDAAQPGDVVLVADGVYTGAGNRDLDFHGKAITVRSAGGANNCRIDSAGTPGDPHRAFIFQSAETAASVLDGFTMTGGVRPQGAVSDTFNGGGILCFNSSPTVRNCTIVGNTASCWGAGVACNMASPTLINCDISENTVGDDGGGLFAYNNSNPTLINCILSHNVSAGTGGAVTTFGVGATFINCTFADNQAPYIGGIYGQHVIVRNSILWGNSGQQFGGAQHDVSYSCIQGGYAGTQNISQDPQFLGGYRNYTPSVTSPCIDAGQNTLVDPRGRVDFYGQARIFSFFGPVRVEMGAIETPSFRYGDLNCDNAVNNFDIDAFVLAITDPSAYDAAFPACAPSLADVNLDGAVNNFDIDPFVAVLTGG